MQHFSLGAELHLLLCQQLDPAEALPESAGASPLTGCRLATVSLHIVLEVGTEDEDPKSGAPLRMRLVGRLLQRTEPRQQSDLEQNR
jgi:hypothetical protein